MTIKEIEFIKNLSTKRTPGPDGFTGEFNETCQEEKKSI